MINRSSKQAKLTCALEEKLHLFIHFAVISASPMLSLLLFFEDQFRVIGIRDIYCTGKKYKDTGYLEKEILGYRASQFPKLCKLF